MKLIVSLICITLLSCTRSSDKFYMPAEWEPQDAVWLGWEEEATQYHPAVISLIKSLIPRVQVKVVVTSDSILRVVKNYLYQNQIDPNKIRFYIMPGNRYWIRDHGAAFLVNNKGQLGVADFDWDRVGYPEWLNYKYDNNPDSVQKYWSLRKKFVNLTSKVDSLMAATENAFILKTNIIHEGGAIEVNGKGTLILCESTVLHRNTNRSREDIESEFRKLLGVRKIIWMKQGLAEDQLSKSGRFIIDKYFTAWGTGGHTDEFVRFVNPNTVMLAWVSPEEKDSNPINKINFERMSENLKILEHATDQDGNPFTIIKIPTPDVTFKRVVVRKNIDDWTTTLDITVSSFKKSEAPSPGDTLLRVPAASYLNYFVTNGLVILPTYVKAGSSKEKEETVRRIFQEQFPNREIVFIDVMPQNWEGGGIHCSTQQQPKHKGQ